MCSDAGGGLDLMQAIHRTHTFPRHFHETYVVEVVEAVVCINPGEVHTSGPAHGRVLRNRAVRVACECLRASLAGQPTLDDLAAQTRLSRFHLLRVFRRATGLPPHQYLLNLRIEQARVLLRRGVPPAPVAARVGFADQSHLNRRFIRNGLRDEDAPDWSSGTVRRFRPAARSKSSATGAGR